jgi:hypothetical protein
MMSKNVYLLLTGALLLLSIGTGFAMQQRQLPGQAAMQALETANFQLGRDTQLTAIHRHKAIALVRQAMREMENAQGKS